jgi:hypothetical protein
MKMPSFNVKTNDRFQDSTDAEFFIEVADGEHAGLCFNLGKVEFLGEDEDGSGRVSFDYDLLFTPETVNLDEQKQEIEQTIAAVLREILEATVRNGDINEIGDIDSEQPSE